MKPKYHYRIVHDWLHKHHGKPDQCENIDCCGTGARFEYALKRGFTHKRDVSHYYRLCSKCHRLYDMTFDKGVKTSKHLAGRYNENLVLGPESRMKKVVLVEENKTFESGKELADYLGCHKASIYKVLHGQRKTIYGNKVVYADS